MSTWNIDHAHSAIEFKVKHLMVSTVRGLFTEFTGSVESENDTFENASIQFTAKTASIATNNATRDEHLRSADFFDITRFPDISFISTSFTKKDDHFEIVGNLTIKDVTKPITLSAVLEGIGPGTNNDRVAGFSIVGNINREDFGLKWNTALETGGVAVSKEVALDIHVELHEETA